MTERELAANIETLCKYLRVRYYHTWTSRHSAPGWPDYAFVTADGRFLLRELKTETGRLTDAQKQWLADLQRAGVDADVWRPEHWPDRVRAELEPRKAGAPKCHI